MARIRTIKPEFWADEKLSPLSPLTRLTFLGLISMADDAGRLLDNAKQIDAFVFPNTNHSTKDALDELARLGRIVRGKTESGQPVIEIAKWQTHQRVTHPSSYTLPSLVKDSGNPPDTIVPLTTTNDLLPTTNDFLPPHGGVSEPHTEPTPKLPASRRSKPTQGARPDTWLTPFRDAWEARLGPASFPFGQAAKYLKPLFDAIGPNEARTRLEGYLGATEPQFVSLARFAATHGAYAAGAKPSELDSLVAEASDMSGVLV